MTEPDFTWVQPYPHVFHVLFPDRAGVIGDVDMAFHFLRFQEHYEGPGFKGSVFTWRQYVAWYKNARGSFSYPYDWSGFNFPGTILRSFRQGAFNPLTRREQALLQGLAQVTDQDYVIGTFASDTESIEHELAHAFWHLDAQYRTKVETILAGGDYRSQRAALAEGDGYDASVFMDEIQACAVEGGFEYSPDPARREQIRAVFKLRCQESA